MSIFRSFNLMAALFLFVCAATTAAEAIGASILWSQGMLTPDKITKYCAVLYGFDLRDLDNPERESLPDAKSEGETLLAERVRAHTLIRDRYSAVYSETGSIQDWTDTLRINRKRFESVKASFGDLLKSMQEEAKTSSLLEVQQTLEVLQPKQAKDLLLRILDDEPLDEEDDIVGDIVAIVGAMPQEKLRKIFGEFKTEPERKTLHRIMLAIGEFEASQEMEPEP